MNDTSKPLRFALAGLAIGAAAGLAVGFDRASAVEPMGFFGLVGFGLGYALHDFNWRARKRAAAVIGGVFAAPLVAIAAMVGLGLMPFELAALPSLIGGSVGAGGLLALLGYGVHSVFHPGNVESLVQNVPASVPGNLHSSPFDDFGSKDRQREQEEWDENQKWATDPFYSWWAGNIWHHAHHRD